MLTLSEERLVEETQHEIVDRALTVAKSVSLEKYWRISPFMVSFVPRSPEA